MEEPMVKPVTPFTPAAPAAPRDLSRDIEQAVEREALDRVRCVRVFNDFYRCNWWAHQTKDSSQRPVADWAALAMQRVRKSRFLSASESSGRLIIEQLDRDRSSAPASE